MRLPLLLSTLLYAGALLSLSLLFRSSAPRAYMDEVFHVPQAQAYCRGRFTQWDDKITTFPGLYATAVLYAKATEVVAPLLMLVGVDVMPSVSATSVSLDSSGQRSSEPVSALCSTAFLRSLNALYGLALVPLLYCILRKLHPASPRTWLLGAIQISLLPTVFFFHFLFYTDSASLVWTLACYLAHLHRWRALSSVLALGSVLMRQTNVAWVGWMVLSELVDAWAVNDQSVFDEKRPALPAGAEKEAKLAARERYDPQRWSSVPRSLASFVLSCVLSLPSIVMEHVGSLLLCIAFVLFVVVNHGSIVLGDKAHHAFAAHLPQVGYFAVFSVGCMAPALGSVRGIRDALAAIRRAPLLTAVAFAAMAVAVHSFTVAHPFLLADNRHYPFYLWKNLFARFALFRYALLPVYLLCFTLMQQAWRSASSTRLLNQLLFWMVTTMCLVLTPLIEFRYFSTPLVLWALQSAPALTQSNWRTAASVALFLAVNAATLFVFLRKPFTWPDGSEARFMW